MVAVINNWKMEELYEADQTVLHKMCLQEILLTFFS